MILIDVISQKKQEFSRFCIGNIMSSAFDTNETNTSNDFNADYNRNQNEIFFDTLFSKTLVSFDRGSTSGYDSSEDDNKNREQLEYFNKRPNQFNRRSMRGRFNKFSRGSRYNSRFDPRRSFKPVPMEFHNGSRICNDWNNKFGCNWQNHRLTKCTFLHICTICKQSDHNEYDCPDKICDYFQRRTGCEFENVTEKQCKWKHICKICKTADHGEYRCSKKLCKYFNGPKGCTHFNEQGKKCMWKHECSMCNTEGHSVQWCPLTACEPWNRMDGCETPGEYCSNPHICGNCGRSDHNRVNCPDPKCLRFKYNKCKYSQMVCGKVH